MWRRRIHKTYTIEKAFLVDECALIELSLKLGSQLDFGLDDDVCVDFLLRRDERILLKH
jgi:hypothetical protein